MWINALNLDGTPGVLDWHLVELIEPFSSPKERLIYVQGIRKWFDSLSSQWRACCVEFALDPPQHRDWFFIEDVEIAVLFKLTYHKHH